MIASRLLVNIVIILLAALVISCGGSSSDDPDSKPPTQKERDTTPDEFSFAPENGAKPNETVTSEATRIQGFDHPADIQIENGEYRLGEGDFTDQNGEIEPGQTLTLRGIAPDGASKTTEVIVTIGGVSASFAIHTQEDRQPPQAKVQFPTVNSATHNEKLTVRGTASDDLGEVESVTLLVENESASNHKEAISEDDFGHWSATIDLAPGDNTITVSTKDEYGNVDEEAAQFRVRKQAFDHAFPEDRGVELGEFNGMAFDKRNNRAIISEYESERGSRLVTININTGRTGILSGPDGDGEENSVRVGLGVAVDDKRNRALWGSMLDDTVYEVDLETGKCKPFSTPSDYTPDPLEWDRPLSIALDPHNSDIAYVVTDTFNTPSHLSKMDTETGRRTIISGAGVGEGDDFPYYPNGVVIDSPGQAAYALGTDEPLYKVNLSTGYRKLVDSSQYPGMDMGDYPCADSIVGEFEKSRLYISDCYQGLVTYDLVKKQWSAKKLDVFSVFTAHLHLNTEDNYLLLTHKNTKGLYLFDLVSDQLIIISKPDTNSN